MLIQDENQLLLLAGELARLCTPPLVIYLSGQLGAGKTTFSRGFLRGLGHLERVKSPTYTLVESYIFDKIQVFHFDLYRIHEAEELELIGIREYFHEKSICLIEWPEQGEGRIPAADINCNLYVEGSARRVEFSTHSDKGARIIEKLKTTVDWPQA